ncbi:hypothetical protein Q8A64_05610 [Oxalobacteraceae bacterium R-40]|uniref:Lipoprotein n=1 Tax=Keguizhuia sedimenti TaxID=3064264 RepID=A0ABU1BLK8_9BURK|nr:hypothetical protein [Oxalobacteraceae bacterium R-40]
MAKKQNILLPMAAALALISCGGGGGGGNDDGNTATTTISGKAVDGYLSGATVFCDANGNGARDGGEMAVTTDNGGNFRFPSACSSVVVVTGGTDTTTGFDFKGKLKANAGSSVVTPLTSLLSGTGLTRAQLAKALALPDGTDIANLDPLASGNGNLYRKTLAAQQIVQQLANVFGTQAHPDLLDELYAHVAKALAAAILASPNTPLFSASGEVDLALIGTAIQNAITSINADPALTDVALTVQDIAAVQSKLEQQVEQFLDAPESGLDNIARDLQDPLDGPIETDTATKDYIYPANDQITINGTPQSLGTFAGAGLPVTGLDTIGLTYAASATNPAIDAVVDVAASLDAVAADDKRVLQVKVERVRVQRNPADGKVSLSLTANTVVTIYVSDRSGTTFNASINDPAFNPVTIVNNDVVVNYDQLVTKIAGSVHNTSAFDASQFTNITGKFTVMFVVSPNMNVRRVIGSSSAALDTLNIGISNTIKGVTGPGIKGTLTIN